jgi:hypothetical protein
MIIIIAHTKMSSKDLFNMGMFHKRLDSYENSEMYKIIEASKFVRNICPCEVISYTKPYVYIDDYNYMVKVNNYTYNNTIDYRILHNILNNYITNIPTKNLPYISAVVYNKKIGLLVIMSLGRPHHAMNNNPRLTIIEYIKDELSEYNTNGCRIFKYKGHLLSVTDNIIYPLSKEDLLLRHQISSMTYCLLHSHNFTNYTDYTDYIIRNNTNAIQQIELFLNNKNIMTRHLPKNTLQKLSKYEYYHAQSRFYIEITIDINVIDDLLQLTVDDTKKIVYIDSICSNSAQKLYIYVKMHDFDNHIDIANALRKLMTFIIHNGIFHHTSNIYIENDVHTLINLKDNDNPIDIINDFKSY